MNPNARRFTGAILGTAGALMAFGVVLHPIWLEWMLEDRLTAAAGRSVEIHGSVVLRRPGRVTTIRAEDVTLAHTRWARYGNVLHARALEIDLDLHAWLSGTAALRAVRIEEPEVYLMATADGAWKGKRPDGEFRPRPWPKWAGSGRSTTISFDAPEQNAPPQWAQARGHGLRWSGRCMPAALTRGPRGPQGVSPFQT